MGLAFPLTQGQLRSGLHPTFCIVKQAMSVAAIPTAEASLELRNMQAVDRTNQTEGL
jgi:hypothetical protein